MDSDAQTYDCKFRMVAGDAAIQQFKRGNLRLIRAFEIGRDVTLFLKSVVILAAVAVPVDLFSAALSKVPLFHGSVAAMCFITFQSDRLLLAASIL